MTLVGLTFYQEILVFSLSTFAWMNVGKATHSPSCIYSTTRLNLSDYLPPHYNKQEPPTTDDFPAVVDLMVTPWAIGKISFEEMFVEMNMFILYKWKDDRIQIPEEHLMCNSTAINYDEAHLIWTPVTTFRNCMACLNIKFDANEDKLRINGTTFWFHTRKSPKLFCNFDLANYPMDSHTCFIEIMPTNDWIKSLRLRDASVHFYLGSYSAPPQFTVTNLQSAGNCSRRDVIAEYVSCIEYSFTLRRQITYHLMVTYAPSTLIVILTWIAFWLDVDVAAPRVALALTSLLTLVTQFANAQKNLPAVSYAKAIDVWMFSCIFIVFASLVEFAIANSINRRNHSVKPVESSKKALDNEKPPCTGNKMDETAKVFFPTVFIVFNVCYWGYYASR